MRQTVERVLADAPTGGWSASDGVHRQPWCTGLLTFRQTLVIFIGLQLGQVMSSIDGTIVATALPTIADDIGGFSRSTWVVSAYALAMVASMPLYGKLGDLYGRRRVLLVAIGVFLVGSMACGLAQTMDQLLAARFLQGLGGGGLGAVAMATVADIVPARQLGRWLGYQGVIFAVASAVGPSSAACSSSTCRGAGPSSSTSRSGWWRRPSSRPACGSPTAASRTPSTGPAPRSSPRAWRSSSCSRPSAATRSPGGRPAPSP